VAEGYRAGQRNGFADDRPLELASEIAFAKGDCINVPVMNTEQQ
jgi:hypothetical protein